MEVGSGEWEEFDVRWNLGEEGGRERESREIIVVLDQKGKK